MHLCCIYDCLRRHWLASPQCSLTLPSNPVLNDSFGLYSADLYIIYCFPPFVSLLLLSNSTILFTHINDNFPPFMGLGAQVPSRWSGLTFSPEYHSRSPSSITRPKPGGVVCSAVSGALSPTLSPSGRPRSPLDGLQTQCAPRNSWPGRGGDPCGFILGYWWLSRGLGQWAPIGLTSRKSSLLFGAEKQVSGWAYRGLRSATAGGRVQELGWS